MSFPCQCSSPGAFQVPPSLIDICLICDGAWLASSNEAGIDWILQDPFTLFHVGGRAQACVLGSALHVQHTSFMWRCIIKWLLCEVTQGFCCILILLCWLLCWRVHIQAQLQFSDYFKSYVICSVVLVGFLFATFLVRWFVLLIVWLLLLSASALFVIGFSFMVYVCLFNCVFSSLVLLSKKILKNINKTNFVH